MSTVHEAIACAILIAASSIAMTMLACASYDSNNVTVELSFNTSGITYSGYAEGETSDGIYTPDDLGEYFACFNTSQNYTTGIIFVGNTFRSISLKTDSPIYTINLTQSLGGNEFTIPITVGGCLLVSSVMNETGAYMTGPFNPFASSGNYTLSMTLRYPGIDIVSAEDVENFNAGSHSLLLEKNETGNLSQIIIESG